MDIKTKVYSGEYELISSGVFISEEDKRAKINIDAPNDTPIDIVFIFKNDENDKNTLTKDTQVVNETTLELTLTNYNSVFGSYNTALLKIGTLANRQLYFSYIIYGMTDSKLKKIEYSFYLGEEVPNGQN